MIPKLTPLIDKFRKWIMMMKPAIVQAFCKAMKDIGEMADWVGKEYKALMKALGGLKGWIDKNMPALGKFIDKFSDLAE